VPYEPLLLMMQQQALGLQQGTGQEVVWCCEHAPIYTTGRRAIDNRTRPDLPAPLLRTDRGGETTFHGQGQLMLYPILNLKGRQLAPRGYVSLLERSAIHLLQHYGIPASQRSGTPGVWTSRGKIAAIGLRISRGVVWHGMALNITTDPAWFNAIRPCGLDLGVDRMANHTTPPAIELVAEQWVKELRQLLANG